MYSCVCVWERLTKCLWVNNNGRFRVKLQVLSKRPNRTDMSPGCPTLGAIFWQCSYSDRVWNIYWHLKAKTNSLQRLELSARFSRICVSVSVRNFSFLSQELESLMQLLTIRLRTFSTQIVWELKIGILPYFALMWNKHCGVRFSLPYFIFSHQFSTLYIIPRNPRTVLKCLPLSYIFFFFFSFSGSMQIPSVSLKRREEACNSLFSESDPLFIYLSV